MLRFKTRIVAILFICCLLFLFMLFYFMFALDDQKIQNYPNTSTKSVLIFGFNEVRRKNESFAENFERQLRVKLSQINIDDYRTLDNVENMRIFLDGLKEDISYNKKQPRSDDLRLIWKTAQRWVRARQTIPERAPELGSVLHALQTANVVKSDVSRKGTQLKLLLTLDGGQYAFFKPMRYSRDYEAEDIYSGADRHNGEIIAFHLSRLLNMRYAPIVASRVLNVSSEIQSTASEALLKTFVTQPDAENRSQLCFYGECYFCNEWSSLVCGNRDGLLEGAIILMLPLQYQLQKLRHPWQRTYKKGLKALWEVDINYCYSVLKNNPMHRVLDFVDTAILDYLIGNADRHHYEVFKDVSNSALLLIDQGKSFGQKLDTNETITILYPLLQCCVLRTSTYHQLRMLVSHGKLSQMIHSLLCSDPLWPLLTDDHLEAIDRRLITILAAIELCFDTYGKSYVLRN